jgi:hypothetical protein
MNLCRRNVGGTFEPTKCATTEGVTDLLIRVTELCRNGLESFDPERLQIAFQSERDNFKGAAIRADNGCVNGMFDGPRWIERHCVGGRAQAPFSQPMRRL